MKKHQHSTTMKPRPEAHWQGSLKTAMRVRQQIADRWGEVEAENYNPQENCFTLKTWNAKGYKVIKGEKALKSYTLVTEFGEQDEDGNAEDGGEKFPKTVCLFYIKQVEKTSERY